MAHKLLRLMVPEPETPFGGLQQVFYAYIVQGTVPMTMNRTGLSKLAGFSTIKSGYGFR